MDLTTTGISGLDAQLGGGVPRGSTILLLAEPGNAIPLFATQFAAGGLARGEDVHYYEFDRPAAGLKQHMLGLAGRSPRQGKLRVFDGYSTQFGKGSIARGEEDVVALTDVDEAPGSILRDVQERPEGAPYRVVVETLSTLLDRGSADEVLPAVKRLGFMGHEMNGLHLVGLVKGMHDPVTETRLRHLADGVLELGMERKGFGIYPYLLVSKMLGLRDPVRILLYKETEKGLWLESTKRVF